MSFTCITHGWRSDQTACPSCQQVKATLALFAQQVAELLDEFNRVLIEDFEAAKDFKLRDKILSLADPKALAAHDVALAQKLLTSFTEQNAKLEADNAKLREELDWALGIVQVSPARLNKSQDERYSQARALLAEPPETQGKETT